MNKKKSPIRRGDQGDYSTWIQVGLLRVSEGDWEELVRCVYELDAVVGDLIDHLHQPTSLPFWARELDDVNARLKDHVRKMTTGK